MKFTIPVKFFLLMAVNVALGQAPNTTKEKIVEMNHYCFFGDHREESMWSALYGAQSGKIYIGVCTHAEAAHFYEFDPVTETMRHIVRFDQAS